MAKYLVIVESPAKVKTIKKFLGANYEVMASQGHVRDLPKSQLGIDVEHDYEPKYITIRGKGDLLASLRKEVKKAEKIYLATDPDREGEAISWHLYYALKLEDKKVYRITFNEITRSAVKESLKHAREIDMNLVDAQFFQGTHQTCLGIMCGRLGKVLLRIKIYKFQYTVLIQVAAQYIFLVLIFLLGIDTHETIKAHFGGCQCKDLILRLNFH